MKKQREVYISSTSDVSLKQNRLMTFGIFEGSKVRIIKDDSFNNLLILGVGRKRIVLRKEELHDIQFKAVNGQ